MDDGDILLRILVIVGTIFLNEASLDFQKSLGSKLNEALTIIQTHKSSELVTLANHLRTILNPS